jgi:hypothetical protein
LVAAARSRRRVRHLDHLRSFNDLDRERTPVCVSVERGLDSCGDSHERYLELEMTGGCEGAVHDGGWRVIATHRVNGDANHVRAELLFLHCTNLSLPVKAAMRANSMRRLRLVTLRTEVGGGGSQRVVGAALRGARLRMSAFWIRHFFP